MKGELDRTIMIYVDSYANRVLSGRFHVASSQDVQFFGSLSQLLIAVNNILDQENFPQAFSKLRNFNAPQGGGENSQGTLNRWTGNAATFVVRILFRQNASWQGNIVYAEKGLSSSFRSVLELLSLMDSVLIEK